MGKKELHIVFGFSSKAILSQSNFVNPEQGDILEFVDLLSQGPLCNLDKIEGIEKRKLWFESIFGSIAYQDGSNSVENDQIRIKKIVETIDNYKKIYLWLGDITDEKITTARLLYHLQGSIIPIFKPDFSKGVFKTTKGEEIHLSSLQALKREDILETAQHFEELKIQDKQYFAELWDLIKSNNAVIHLFDKENNYCSTDESFFDQYLLKRCTDLFQDSTLIVAYTLYDIWNDFGFGNIGDSFLFYRLNHLDAKGVLEIRTRSDDPEKSQRIFNVRRIN